MSGIVREVQMEATSDSKESPYVPQPQNPPHNRQSGSHIPQNVQCNTHPPNGGPINSRRLKTPLVIQPSLANDPTDKSSPSPAYGSKSCSIILCSNSSTRRYPAKSFGTLDIRSQLNGIKTTDQELFQAFRRGYYGSLRPPLQRSLSIRALKQIVVVEYTDDEDPVPLRMNASLRRDLISFFRNPNLISTEHEWVNFFCALGEDRHHYYGLLFLDDWDAQKIAVLVGAPLLISIATAIVWIACTRDIQAAMAVSTYILSATGVVLGLLGLLGTIET
ncbi:hypothetical protein DFP73DRAFT_206471 [Morchella snyderi]|nr:hypothetical protein DFP73DRAFT_206471 [Morchella snyderi]